MEEGQEHKHVCKFCSKSFPCGRSLGGHMRYHVINSTETGTRRLKTKKLSSVDNGGTKANPDTGYGLRENPKKTCRFADSNEDTLLHGKLCKDCGKVFQSWKTLSGHMKCHLERISSSTLDEESWTRTIAHQKLVMDSQSDNEAVAPNRRKRSSRRGKRYKSATTSSSFSVAKASSSASEIEQEQEEVAMCLMMLSRDVGRLGSSNSVAESSDNNSDFSEPQPLSPTNQVALHGDKSSLSHSGKVVKFKKLTNKKLEYTLLNSENSKFDGKQTEFGVSDFSRTESKMNRSGVSVNGYLGNGILNKLKVAEPEFELGKNAIDEIGLDRDQLGDSKNQSSSKRKCRNLLGTELDWKVPKKLTCGVLGSEMHRCSEKRGKFECATCNKTFHSYQALGGHRASHKKTKACFVLKIDNSDNSIETKVSPNPIADAKLIKSFNNYSIYHEMVSNCAEKAETSHGSKRGTEHECPICFKVFSSGQALGGHKRSHLVSGPLGRSNQAIVAQKPIHGIRDLDLNLPAPGEEESNGHVGFKPWWVGINHKHDPLVTLSAL